MRFLLSVGLFKLLSFALAQSIDLNDGPPSCSDIWVSVENQTQLDFYSTCPVFEDVIFVGHDFSGPFKLPGIVSVGRISAGYFGPSISGSSIYWGDGVTSISFPDLKNTTQSWNGGFVAMYLEFLNDVSFPKLEIITGDLGLMGNPKLKKASFPALKSVSRGILIDGEYDEISFPSLKEVGYMSIKSTGTLDCIALGKNLSSLVLTATEKPLGSDLGFTCWTPDENNKWDSKQGAQAAGPSSTGSGSSASETGSGPSASGTGSGPSASGTGSGSSSNDAGNAAASLHVGVVNVVFASVGLALVERLLM